MKLLRTSTIVKITSKENKQNQLGQPSIFCSPTYHPELISLYSSAGVGGLISLVWIKSSICKEIRGFTDRSRLCT